MVSVTGLHNDGADQGQELHQHHHGSERREAGRIRNPLRHREGVGNLVHVSVAVLPDQHACVIGDQPDQEHVKRTVDLLKHPVRDGERTIPVSLPCAHRHTRHAVQEACREDHDKDGALEDAREVDLDRREIYFPGTGSGGDRGKNNRRQGWLRSFFGLACLLTPFGETEPVIGKDQEEHSNANPQQTIPQHQPAQAQRV